MVSDGTFVMDVDRGTPQRVLAEFDHGQNIFVISAAWHPRWQKDFVLGMGTRRRPSFWTMPAQADTQFDRKSPPKFSNSLEMYWQTPGIRIEDGFGILMVGFGRGDLLRACISRLQEFVEDVRRSKNAEGHRN
jgi:hypothetical protein